MIFFKRKPKQPIVDVAEFLRLKAIEAQVAKLITLLDKSEVDYDLVEEIKRLLNG